MQAEAAVPSNMQVELTPLPPLLELSVSDSKVKYSAEESRLRMESLPKPYMSLNTSAKTLRDFLDQENQSATSSPCKLLHVTFHFSQPILLEVITF